MTQERHVVGKVGDIPPGSRKIVEIGHRSIGVFNVHGEFFALLNRCPHQGAPLCLGAISGTMLPAEPGQYTYGLHGRVLRCPWHGWEFDITTGEMIFVPDPVHARSYDVAVEPPELETFPIVIEDSTIVLYI